MRNKLSLVKKVNKNKNNLNAEFLILGFYSIFIGSGLFFFKYM